MKSLLVDALRQARENKAEADAAADDAPALGLSPDDAERAPEIATESVPATVEQPAAESLSLQDSARLERAELDAASNEELEIAPPTPGELALMQTTRDLNLTAEDFETDLDPEFGSELDDDPATDAAFDEAFEIGAAAPAGSTANAVFVEDRRPDGFLERAGAWLPLVCVLLSAAAVGVVPLWDMVTSGEPGIGLVAQSGMARNIEEPGPVGPTSRFPFIEMTEEAAAVAPPASAGEIESPPAAAPIVRRSVRPRPAGTTRVDVDTFRNLEGAYSAYHSGEIAAMSLQAILDHHVAAADPATETELKLLLQQYPEDVRLHRALGALLNNAGRWPEAQAVLARAAALGGGAQ